MTKAQLILHQPNIMNFTYTSLLSFREDAATRQDSASERSYERGTPLLPGNRREEVGSNPLKCFGDAEQEAKK